jgi:signal transduction histidine kinase/ActR/RegA family two-component response regulator
VGQVWATGRGAWGSSDAGDSAADVKDPTAFAVPVRGREVIGVMLFYRREPQRLDDELLTTVTDIGGQIGQFLERREAEDALRATEEQLRQTQKMEAIGKLAGGVAHDFNNLLTVILGRCELAIDRLGTKDLAGHDLVLIRATAQRAAALTRQLLAFGRKQVLQPRPLDLNAVVEGISPMLRRLVGEDVEQVVRLRPGVGRVMADPSQIEQVILNLVINARDAMPKGGRLTIETANVEPDAAYLRRHPGVNAGAQVMLAVSDTGIGMDAETRARVFEPFFTTKEPGKGTGLGLATVHGIVEQSGGTVFAYSEPQQGSVFKVYLPRLDSAAVSATSAPVTVATPRGSETILLVEDEVEVRELARDVLEMHGYTVLEAGDPDEARRLFSAHREAISLLLTDVVMPQASGRDLANLLCPLRPEMKVLYMSGYTDQAIVHHGVLEAGVAYLEKPFTIEGLMRKVRDVLDAPAAANGSS